MASIKLHPQVVSGLEKIPSLTEDNLRELLSVLEQYPLKLYQGSIFKEDIALQMQTFSSRDAKAINTAIFGLYMGRVGVDVALTKYVNDIVEFLREEKEDSIEWLSSDEDVNQFKERLTRLLSIKNIEIVAKAQDVLLEHEKTFSSARIVTDVRSVFCNGVDDKPSAAVIVHMLGVVYFQATRHQELFVALDTKDIDELIKTLERAKTKAESLQSVLASTDIPYVEVV